MDFSTSQAKRLKSLKKQAKKGHVDPDANDPFQLFVNSTTIRYCLYKDSHKILGNTFGMLVLQDFESITPNVLARTMETVEGGGSIVLLLKSMASLRQLYTIVLDVHARLRSASHKKVTGRFVERFILSLGACQSCLVCDEELNILPISSHIRTISALPPAADTRNPRQRELDALKTTLQDSEMICALVKKARTLDQAKALLVFIEAIAEKTLRTTVALTAARGRGKSASLGLAVAYAIGMGYSNVFVSSPHPENLKTFFDFVFQGFDALKYEEHQDYELLTSTNEAYSGCVVRVNVFHTHRQTIQYIHPSEGGKLGHAELVVIDEAAAIPLPLVRSMFGPHLLFLSSTVNGYEGTGRALSLKLIKGLRDSAAAGGGRALKELTMTEPIRYAEGDAVEQWLNKLLCLDSALAPPSAAPNMCPHPSTTSLYHVNKDALFSFHKASEVFLQRMVALFVSSHYKNSPNDLMLMSDAPAHHLFVLLGPINPESSDLPEILCAVQVCLEGGIAGESIASALASTGKTDSGDLIPWIISQQYQDPSFGQLNGGRIVRIATHPNYQGMRYGTRALELLTQYYSGQLSGFAADGEDPDEQDGDAEGGVVAAESGNGGLLKEVLKPRKLKRSLLSALTERKAEELDYLGVSFGVTDQLYRFWQRSEFHPLYVRLTPNEITGEHTCIMVKPLTSNNSWLTGLEFDFQRRLAHLLGYDLRSLSTDLALRLLSFDPAKARVMTAPDGGQPPALSDAVIRTFSPYDRSRLTAYTQSHVDYHVVLDMIPSLALMLVNGIFREDISLNWSQAQILVGVGLQKKSLDSLATELSLTSNQVLAFFQKTLHKICKAFTKVEEQQAEQQVEKEGKGAGKIAAAGNVDDDADKKKKKKKKKDKKASKSDAEDEDGGAPVSASKRQRNEEDDDDNDDNGGDGKEVGKEGDDGLDLGDEFAMPEEDDEGWKDALRETSLRQGDALNEISVKRKMTKQEIAHQLKKMSKKKKGKQ